MISRRLYHLISLLILFFIISFYKIYSQPHSANNNYVAFTNGTVVTISGETIEEGTVVFKNGKITAVGNDIEIPEDANIIDISGKYLYPAMIHSGSHLGLIEVSMVRETVDVDEYGDINPNVRAEVAFNPGSRHIPLARDHGIAVAVVKPKGGLISGMAAAMLTDGWTWEDMVYKAPLAMVINWPSMNDVEKRNKAINELNETFQKARRYHIAKQASEKHFHPVDIRWEAMIPVLEKEIPIIINASEYRQIQAAIKWAEKQNLRIILSGVRDADMVINHLKDKDIPVIINSVFSGPSRKWESYDKTLSLPAKLNEANITFSISGETAASDLLRLPNHAAAAVAFGLPEKEALKSITLYPAEIFGIDNKLGSIEEGKDASFIIANGNLLHITTQIEQVYIKGIKTDMMNKHRLFYEKYREKYNGINK